MRVKLIHDVVGSYVRQKFLSKKLRLPIFTPDGWKDEPLDLEEIIRAMMNWVSMTIMWFKPLQGAGNGIHGMLLTHRDALKGNISKLGINGVKHDDVDFELKDIVRAEAEYTSYIKHAAMGQIMQNKMFLMARHMNYFGNNFDYATMEKTRIVKSMRHLSPNTYYMFHSMPEEFISMTTMAAQLMHIKVGDTGKSLWDFYEVKETTQGSGNYDIVYTGPIRGVVKSGTEVVNGVNAAVYTQLRGLSVREIQRMKRVHERLQGGYRREEAAYIEAYVLGKFFIQLKKYFPRLIINAVHSLKYDNDLGKYVQEFNIDGTPKLREVKDENGNITKEPIWVWQARVVQGRWITLAKMIAYYMTVGHSDSAYSWNRLLPEQKQNIIEAATTLMFYAQFYGAYLLLFGGIDDDDWAKKWWKMYLVGNLSQQYNPMDLAQSLKTIFTPVAAAKMFQTADGVVSLLHGTMGYALTGDESMMYTQDGKIRGLNNVLKQIPFAAQINDYKNRFENSADMSDYFDNLRLK